MSSQVHVAIRVRPLDPPLDTSNDKVWVYNDTSIVHQSLETGKDAVIYTFDRVYNEEETNDAVFRESAMDIVDSVIQGINGTIFTYGQTASGKTFTMCGDDQNPGIISLVAQKLFNYVKSLPNQKFTIHIGYIEIYNEVVTDLLNPENTNLKIHESQSGDIFVGQLTEEHVTELSQVKKLLKLGEQNRKVGNTNMTERSSRSHTIFKIKVKSEKLSDWPKDIASSYNYDGCLYDSSSDSESQNQGPLQGPYDQGRKTKISVLNLVDLAGSERASLTGAEGTRLKEGSHINKSLLALKRVISTLAEKKGVSHVPFRDSKLTRILQPALGGNSRTAIICTITPSSLYQEESHTTLKFADCAKKIRTKPRVNESTGEAKRFFLKHIKALESQLIISHQVIAQYKKHSLQVLGEGSADQVCDTRTQEVQLPSDLLTVREQPKDTLKYTEGGNERKITREVSWYGSLEKNSWLKQLPLRNSLSLDGPSAALAWPEYKNTNSVKRMSYEGELEVSNKLVDSADRLQSTKFQSHLDKLDLSLVKQRSRESEEDQKAGLVSSQFEEANENLESDKCNRSEFLSVRLEEVTRELEQKAFDIENKRQEMDRLQEELSSIRDVVIQFLSVADSVSEFKKEDIEIDEHKAPLEEQEHQGQENGLNGGYWRLEATTGILELLEQFKGWLKNVNVKRLEAMQEARYAQKDATWEAVDQTQWPERSVQVEDVLENTSLWLEHVENQKESGEGFTSVEESKQYKVKESCRAELRKIDIAEVERQVSFENELQRLWTKLIDTYGISDIDASDLDTKVEVRKEELKASVKEFIDAVDDRWRKAIDSLKRQRASLEKVEHENANQQNVQNLNHSSYSSNYLLEHMNLENQLEASLLNCKKLEKEKEYLMVQLQQVNKQLEVSDKQIESLREKSQENGTRYINLENMNAQSQSAIQKMEEELVQSRESYRKLKSNYDSEVTNSEEKVARLEVERDIAKKQLLVSREKERVQEGTIQELSKSLEELKGRMSKKSVESNEYDKRAEKQLKQINALEHKVKAQDELIEELRAQVSGFMLSEERIKSKVEFLSNENLAYKNSEKQRQNLEKRYLELERQFENLSVDANRVAELKCSLEASLEREKKMKKEVNALRISSNEYAVYKVNNEKLAREYETQLRQAQSNLEYLTAQHELLFNNYKKENADLLEKIGKLESAVNPLEFEKRQIEARYNESQKELVGLKSKINELSLKWQMALQEADESHFKCDRLQKELDKLRNEFRNLSCEKDSIERRTTQLSETVSQLKVEEAKKPAQLELDQQYLSLIKLKDENHRMSKELNEARLELFKARSLLYNAGDQKENDVNFVNCASPSLMHDEDVGSELYEEEDILKWMKGSNSSSLRVLEEYKNEGSQEPEDVIIKLSKNISCYYANKLESYKRATRDLKKNLEKTLKTKEYTEACWQDKYNKQTCILEELKTNLNFLYKYAQQKKKECLILEEEHRKCLMSKEEHI